MKPRPSLRFASRKPAFRLRRYATAILCACWAACGAGFDELKLEEFNYQGPPRVVKSDSPTTFAEDLTFLRKHTSPIVLKSKDGLGRVVVAPEYQGRVMTSSTSGEAGSSIGYVHRPTIALGKRTPHQTLIGGEDRFSLGPEGGQFGLFFPQNAPFEPDHYQVPEPLDYGAWPVTESSDQHVSFQKEMRLTNYAGTSFSLRVERTVRMLDRPRIAELVGEGLVPEIQAVGIESENSVTNTGEVPWDKQTGLLSITTSGAFASSPTAIVIIPIFTGSRSKYGPPFNDEYLGSAKVASARVLRGAIGFHVNGREHAKIGISRSRARDVVGVYDGRSKVLTLVIFTLPKDAREYVSSLWKVKEAPFSGDAITVFSEGPSGKEKVPGRYFEIATSSPALALSPQASATHRQSTLHLTGPPELLDALARQKLGVSIQAALATMNLRTRTR